LQLHVEGSSHVVAVQAMTDFGEFYLISAYFQFSHSVEPYLEVLDKLVGSIRHNNVNNQIIIAANVNASSTSWYSRTTDERGDAVEEFITANNLVILNRASIFTTYASPSGTSNIDVTLSTAGIARRIHDWHISPDMTISDHNAIILKLAPSRTSETRPHPGALCFRTRNANWEKFDEEVRRVADFSFKERLAFLPPQRATELLTKRLQEICKRILGTKRRYGKTVPWWTETLSVLRREVQSARRQLSRLRRLGIADDLAQTLRRYKKTRADYIREIRRCKITSWQNFVTAKGNEDPWGIVYKILRNKIRSDFNTFHSVREGEASTLTWSDTARRLLDKMVPTNIETDDADAHSIIGKINCYSSANMEPLITEEEAEEAVKKLRNNKAPGLDGINPEIVKRLWRTDKEIILILLNNCLRASSFPDSWKQAILKPILKDIQKDPAQIQSYRPIALLPVMGKVYERIIVNRIQDLYIERGLDNHVQYGFKPGRATDDALHRVVTLIRGCPSKYAVIIFFDIAGAFDNLWWPGILSRITQTHCSSQLFSILRQYFSDRHMILSTRHDKVTKQMTKGCPQGSIIGPLAWNWSMDDLLNRFGELEGSGTLATAYADDLALLISGSSRNNIEANALRAIEILQKWCASYKLQIAVDKTKAILVKGKFHYERMPRIQVQSRKIEFVSEHRYLGIHIDKNLSFIPHIQHLRDKINALSGLLRRTVHEEWGLRRKAYLLLYKGLYLPVITYGAIAWYDRASHSHVSRILSSIQRKLLISMTRACRTTSTAASYCWMYASKTRNN